MFTAEAFRIVGAFGLAILAGWALSRLLESGALGRLARMVRDRAGR